MKKYTGSNPMKGKYFDFKKRQWVEERFFPWGDPEYRAFYGIPEIDINYLNVVKKKVEAFKGEVKKKIEAQVELKNETVTNEE